MVTGDLTTRGVTVTTKLIVAFCGAVSDPFANLRVGFHAATTIGRRHLRPLLDLENHTGNLPMASEVTIEINAEAVHPSVPTAPLSISPLRVDNRKG